MIEYNLEDIKDNKLRYIFIEIKRREDVINMFYNLNIEEEKRMDLFYRLYSSLHKDSSLIINYITPMDIIGIIDAELEFYKKVFENMIKTKNKV